MIEHELPKPEPKASDTTGPDAAADVTSDSDEPTEETTNTLKLRSLDPAANGFVEIKEPDAQESYESGSDFEDPGIKGVYYRDEDGDLVEFGASDNDFDD